MRRKIHQQLMRRQRFIVVAVLLGIGLFVLWARSRHLPLLDIIGSTSALLISALLVGGYYYKWAWTGFTDYAYPEFDGVEFHHRKTLWDWLQLLIIPSVLAVAALLFNAQSTQTQLDITTDNQREAALQTYIDKMSELLLDGKLRMSEADSEIRSVARTRTLSTLRQLDGTRKGQVLQFLHESRLISGANAVIALQEANLEETRLHGADLQGANLEATRLHGADLHWTNLEATRLHGADLQGANLQGVILASADLSRADLSRANLSEANLLLADLSRANLSGANFTRANLEATNLEGAFLSGANFSGAVVTQEQLAQAASLTGATMPDGSIHDQRSSPCPPPPTSKNTPSGDWSRPAMP
jgi:uncharacterized protein YjbI with pentapeptide repeats